MKKATFSIIVVVLALAMLSCSLVTSILKSNEPGNTPEPQTGELVFSPDTLPDGQVGAAYEAVVTLSNNRTPAFRMEIDQGRLPHGLTGYFDGEKQTFTITGTPTEAGIYSFEVSAICYGTNRAGQMGSKDFTLVVKLG
jgi:hypothetical protein